MKVNTFISYRFLSVAQILQAKIWNKIIVFPGTKRRISSSKYIRWRWWIILTCFKITHGGLEYVLGSAWLDAGIFCENQNFSPLPSPFFSPHPHPLNRLLRRLRRNSLLKETEFFLFVSQCSIFSLRVLFAYWWHEMYVIHKESTNLMGIGKQQFEILFHVFIGTIWEWRTWATPIWVKI